MFGVDEEGKESIHQPVQKKCYTFKYCTSYTLPNEEEEQKESKLND